MNKKMIIGFVVLAFVMAGMVFGMGIIPQSDYKLYKNDELGFSFKYPKAWFLDETPEGLRGVLLFGLTNFNPRKAPGITMKERVEIDCLVYQDTNGSLPKGINDRLLRIRNRTGKQIDIKDIQVKKVKGGAVFIVKGRPSSGLEAKRKEYEMGFMYLSGEKGNTFVKFMPYRLADKAAYLKLLKSIEIYEKHNKNNN